MQFRVTLTEKEKPDKDYDSRYLGGETTTTGATGFGGIILGVILIAVGVLVFLFGGSGEGSPVAALVVLGAAGALFIYGHFQGRKRAQYVSRLTLTGEVHYADITDCIMHKNYDRRGIRGRNTYTLICQYTTRSGARKECKMYALGYDPRPYISSGKLRVYVDPTNTRDYANFFIDLPGSMDSLPPEMQSDPTLR